MDEKRINTKLDEINSLLSTHAELFNNVHKLIDELNHEIFIESCHKPYLKNCEPMYCSYRIANTCEYFDRLAPLLRITEKVNIKL